MLKSPLFILLLAAAPVIAPGAPARVAPSATGPIQIHVDASDAPRRLFHATLQFPVKPGPMSLLYPKWIPGEHGPTGPIDDLVGIRMTANGQPVLWRRDDVNIFEFHIDIPEGVQALDVALDFIAPPDSGGFSSGSSTTPELAVVSWNQVLLYPEGIPVDRIPYQATLKIPAGWSYGTALPVDHDAGNEIFFKPSSLATLVDSPVQTGAFLRTVNLSPDGVVPQYLHIAADSERATRITDTEVQHFRNLVLEANALFRARHYRDYHFLLTLSDHIAHFGLEHHESSDDRSDEDTLIDEDLMRVNGDLLPHEYAHSWNGKYRRPADLATPDYNTPMKGDLLWVYEGLTQYLGEVLAPRSGLWSPEDFRDALARDAAALDHEAGRRWRSLEDTAVSAQSLYNARTDYSGLRRGADFYEEGTLIWLDVDVELRTLSRNRKSIDDFCRAFAGPPASGPEVRPYTFDDVVATLNSVQPYDWASFLGNRLNSTSAHAPLNGILNGGYQLVYTSVRSDLWRTEEYTTRVTNLSYSLGFSVRDSGSVIDVHLNTPAFRAGLAPAVTIVAVNGRQFSPPLLHHAVQDAINTTAPIQLLVKDGEYYKTISIDYHDGEKFPHLARDRSKPDLIADIVRPLIAAARSASAGSQ